MIEDSWQYASISLFDRESTARDAYPAVRVFRTVEVPVANAALREAYAPNKLTVGHNADDFELQLIRAGFGPLEISAMSVGTDVALVVPPADGLYVVILPVTGGVTVGTRGETVVLGDDIGVVANAGQPLYFESWSPDCRFVCVRFDKRRLEQALVRLGRRSLTGNLQFAFRIDLAQPKVAPFHRAVQLPVSELSNPGSQMSPSLADSVAQLVTNALLLHQPHSHSSLLDTPEGDLPSALRDAQQFMRGHLGEEITVADIAKASKVSVRTLEELFQKGVGISPMASFRELRLARAHEDLTTAGPDSTTVAKIAKRWGFRHQGRFAVEYRRAYGISPSAQLRQMASRASSPA